MGPTRVLGLEQQFHQSSCRLLTEAALTTMASALPHNYPQLGFGQFKNGHLREKVLFYFFLFQKLCSLTHIPNILGLCEALRIFCLFLWFLRKDLIM